MAAGRRGGSWSSWPPYEESRPRPVEGGLTARRQRGAIGDTWWSKRFIEVLERYGVGGRMQRGRRYARVGQVLELTVAPGLVAARVQGSRATPYRCQLALPSLSGAQWDDVFDALAARAAYAARLLAGEMPTDIEAVFDAVGAPLFPARRSDMRGSCSCPDWENPCKHLAAVLYLLAEQFDADPFVVLTWRGRDRASVLEELRRRRGAVSHAADARPGGGAARPAAWWPDGVVAGTTTSFWDEPPTPTAEGTASTPVGTGLQRLPPLDRRAFNRPVGELLAPAYDRLVDEAAP